MFYRNVAEISIDKDLKGKVKSMISDNEMKEKGNKIKGQQIKGVNKEKHQK